MWLAWACAGGAGAGAGSWAGAGPPARIDSRARARVVGTGRGRMVDPLHDVGVIPCSTAVAPLQSLHPHGEIIPWVERWRGRQRALPASHLQERPPTSSG